MYILFLICIKSRKKVALKSKVFLKKSWLVRKKYVPLHPLTRKRPLEAQKKEFFERFT